MNPQNATLIRVRHILCHAQLSKLAGLARHYYAGNGRACYLEGFSTRANVCWLVFEGNATGSFAIINAGCIVKCHVFLWGDHMRHGTNCIAILSE